MRRFFTAGIILLILLFYPRFANAVTTSIIDFPKTINAEEFNVTASVSGALAGINYLRADLYKDGTTNYFGETYNGSDWYSGSDGQQYYQITIDSDKTWAGAIKAKVGNPTKTDYPEPGEYKLRLRRYTSKSNYNNDEAKSNSISLVIDIPNPTPVPPSEIPTTPTNIFISPTNTLAPTKTPVPPTPTVKPASTLVSSSAGPSVVNLTGMVLSVQEQPEDAIFDETDFKINDLTASESPTPETTASPTPAVLGAYSLPRSIAMLMIGAGALIFGSSAIYLAVKYKSDEI